MIFRFLTLIQLSFECLISDHNIWSSVEDIHWRMVSPIATHVAFRTIFLRLAWGSRREASWYCGLLFQILDHCNSLHDPICGSLRNFSVWSYWACLWTLVNGLRWSCYWINGATRLTKTTMLSTNNAKGKILSMGVNYYILTLVLKILGWLLLRPCCRLHVALWSFQ